MAAKGQGGRPAFQPTDAQRRQVESMAGFGIPHDDIAKVLQIDAKTLRKHFPDELEMGHIKANTAVARNLFRIATGNGREAVTAAIFWTKTRMGWNDRPAGSADAPGKKEQRETDAATAQEGTEWEAVLRH